MSIYLYSETVKQFFDQNDEIIKEYKLELKKCPVCDSKKQKFLFSHYNFHYWKCKDCSFVYSNPRLNNKGSYKWYNSNFYNAAIESEFYLVKKEKYPASPDNFHDCKNLIAKIDLKENSNIIDIGCGNGAFLDYLRENTQFYNLHGIDLNKKAVEFAKEIRNLNVVRHNINDYNPKGKFDLVISMESIEHANDLRHFMFNITKFIERKGYLIITTPYNDRLHTMIGGVWGDHYMAPNHINFFNLKSMKTLLGKYNFQSKEFIIKKTHLPIFSLKSYKYKRDWATADPPTRVQHGLSIPKDETNHKKYLRFIKAEYGKFSYLRNNDNYRKKIKKSIKKFIYAGFNFLGFKVKYRIIVLAQKTK